MVVKSSVALPARPRGVERPAACALQGATQSDDKFYSTKPILQAIFRKTRIDFSTNSNVQTPHPSPQTNNRLRHVEEPVLPA
jgi:hypothetical protein